MVYTRLYLDPLVEEIIKKHVNTDTFPQKIDDLIKDRCTLPGVGKYILTRLSTVDTIGMTLSDKIYCAKLDILPEPGR